VRAGFALIDLLIVVVVLAILVGAVIPRFADTSHDARETVALTNLRTLRLQIQFYKAHHDGRTPDTALASLLIATDPWGVPTSEGAGLSFGPYLRAIPANPLTNKSTVTVTGIAPPVAASPSSDRGWLYHAATGNVWLDDPGYLDR
jgi:general secretion pathway protein G